MGHRLRTQKKKGEKTERPERGGTSVQGRRRSRSCRDAGEIRPESNFLAGEMAGHWEGQLDKGRSGKSFMSQIGEWFIQHRYWQG